MNTLFQIRKGSSSDSSQSNNSAQIYFISLGCSKNLVDTEVMLGTVVESGFSLIDDPAKAQIIVVNTCGFLTSAIEEAIEHILEMAEYKDKNKGVCQCLVVTGCLPQRHKDKLIQGFPEVDLFLGVDEYPHLGNYLKDFPKLPQKGFWQRSSYLVDFNSPRISATGSISRYVKIAEGCNNSCSFCIIPHIRGRLKSRSIESVVKEVELLTSSGVKEITLIAQDLTQFGVDREEKDGLLNLLRAIEKIEAPFWLRLLYNYPEHITDELITFISESSKVVPYLDIPMQHAADPILKSMKRGITAENQKKILAKLRKKIPDIAIRTSLIVGFPGETEGDFEELADFVKEAAFDHLGVFTYSNEEGTYSARLPDQLDDEIKEQRRDKIMEIQQAINFRKNEEMVGEVVPVLVLGESKESELLVEGRMKQQAPEVDGVVLINKGTANAGDVIQVKITESAGYDLVGEIFE